LGFYFCFWVDGVMRLLTWLVWCSCGFRWAWYESAACTGGVSVLMLGLVEGIFVGLWSIYSDRVSCIHVCSSCGMCISGYTSSVFSVTENDGFISC
jgi:hypothetical protein